MKKNTATGRINATNGENVRLILENDEVLKGRIRLNTFKNAIEVKFVKPGDDTPTQWRPIEDTDFSSVADYITRRYDMQPEEGLVGRRVAGVAKDNAHDPLTEYLTSLKWDGKPRITNWLTHYMGVEDSKYSQLIGRKWLISAVARGLNPGAKVDTILIAEGKQGIRKSSAFRALAGAEFFSDTPIDMGSKDGRLALQGVWILELAELESLRKAEATRVKGFLSQNSDKFRPPYGKVDVVVPRRCVFCGSSNTYSYLVDTSGNRRYWPTRCGDIDIDAIKRDRDQLWAEARSAYEANEPWWLDSEVEQTLAEAEADTRVEEDPWTELLSAYLAPREHTAITREELLIAALNKTTKDWDRRALLRLNDTLTRMGWIHVRRRVAGKLKWFYQFGTEAPLGTPLYTDAETRRATSVAVSNNPGDFYDVRAKFPVPAKPGASA